MARTVYCNKGGDQNEAVVLISYLDTGAVDSPCMEHFVGLACAIATEAGMTWPTPAPDPQPDDEATAEADVDAAAPAPAPPDLMVERVVRRGQTRKRTRPEQRAIHAKADQEARAAQDT